MHWAVEVYMPFSSNVKGDRGFQRTSRQFTGRQERANMWGTNSCWATQKQWDTEKLNKQALLGVSISAHLVYM